MNRLLKLYFILTLNPLFHHCFHLGTPRAYSVGYDAPTVHSKEDP